MANGDKPTTQDHSQSVDAAIDGDGRMPAGPPTDLDDLTPAMRQYWEQKRQVPGAILLFRMGDFYELFYDDAQHCAKLLGITLTSRDKGRTPLAGIPYHALEGYLAKLVAAGERVAISEQVEDARQAKGVVRREIVRIVTPGTLTDDALLERAASNIVVAVFENDAEVGIAALELASGQLTVRVLPEPQLVDELARIGPAEILLPEGLGVGPHPREAELSERVGAAVTVRPAADFGAKRAEQLLTRQFETRGLRGFGFEHMDASLQAAGALLAFVDETQRGAARHLQPPRRVQDGAFVTLDQVTLRSLEIERTLREGGRSGALVGALDYSTNPMGARLTRQWLLYPLRDIEVIRGRQALIGDLRAASAPRTALRRALRDVGDMERMVGRLGVLRATPRDMRALGDGLSALGPIRDMLSSVSPRAAALVDRLAGVDEIGERLRGVLSEEAPIAMRDGGIFADGHHAELDRLRLIGTNGARWLADYQAREIERTGIANLKVGYTRVFGYYIEISNANRDRAPADYQRKQTLKNCERFITDELKRYESDVLSAASRAQLLEYDLFCELREETLQHAAALQRVCAAVAELDALCGWAELAARRDYCRPEFVDDATLEITDGRHPVIEQTLGARFVPNDTSLQVGAAALALITGPNMAGKSTYIRQVALLTLMAHAGCWVPARAMRLGVVDRIFTRVGASDELARGQSTFMVEMTETANILHNATRHSLVILDEVGRGTSTYDGVALAW
ncbi:MAG: DNA mismatch repair protein MutS, partial [Phycisphaerales bacterium]|nr:DNA mismatch repair protein MutS [Phycisphaerales bacterium]